MPPFFTSEPVQVIILAIVQGIAEFLPISSSGHLVVLGSLLGMNEGTSELSIILHFGTLLAIVLFYWKRIVALFQEDRRVIPVLIAGTLPAIVVGLLIKTYYPEITESPFLVGFTLPMTGMLLLLLPKIKEGEIDYQKLGYGRAILIGCAQAFAILPGISRSGSTIVVACALGLKRQAAATFSFLLAIPAILGASVLEFKDMLVEEGPRTSSLGMLAVGAVISFVVGWLALTWLVRWVEKGQLHWFAYWVIPVGFLVALWQLNQWVQFQINL